MIWTALHNLRFRKKMIITYCLIALIPLLLFSFVIGSILIMDTKRTSAVHAEQVVNQMSESIDVYIGSIEKLIDYIIADAQSIDATDSNQVAELEKTLKNITISYPEVAGIMITYADDSYLCSGMTRISRDLFTDEAWYQTATQKEGNIGVISTAVGRNIVTNVNYSADRVFSLVKQFATCDGKNGVVLLDIRHDIIEQLMGRVSIGANGFLYIVDSMDEIVYAPQNEVVYRIDKDTYRSVGSEVQTLKIMGNDYYVVNYFSEYTDWRSVGVIPDSEYASSIERVYWVLLATILASCVLVPIVAIKTADSVTRPINKLERLMSKVENGDFTVRFHAEYLDEIGLLGKSFNHMLEKIDELIYQLYIEKQSKLEAQLKALQEQIKPHFLYNTLDTISWMARKHQAMDVVNLVDALTNMFRVGLSRGKDFIPLSDEKNHVANYLYIQKTRYQDKLNYAIDFPEQYDSIVVPKLILQPLVENAIYHGIKLKRGGGTITLHCQEDNGALQISVSDDGAGVSLERLQTLQEQLITPGNVETKAGFGLLYVAQRILLCYGEQYQTTIESTENIGTKVTIRLPIRKV